MLVIASPKEQQKRDFEAHDVDHHNDKEDHEEQGAQLHFQSGDAGVEAQVGGGGEVVEEIVD